MGDELMANMKVNGLEEYAEKLAILFKDSENVTRKAVYDGAEIVADTIKAGLKTLPIQEGENGLPPYAQEGVMLTGISRKQKQDLIDDFGLAPIENDDGYIQTKAGVDGYGSIRTKKYPKGLPNALLMRSIESGSSFRKKNPIFRKAVNQSREKAVKKMGETIDEEIKKIMEG